MASLPKTKDLSTECIVLYHMLYYSIYRINCSCAPNEERKVIILVTVDTT